MKIEIALCRLSELWCSVEWVDTCYAPRNQSCVELWQMSFAYWYWLIGDVNMTDHCLLKKKWMGAIFQRIFLEIQVLKCHQSSTFISKLWNKSAVKCSITQLLTQLHPYSNVPENVGNVIIVSYGKIKCGLSPNWNTVHLKTRGTQMFIYC